MQAREKYWTDIRESLADGTQPDEVAVYLWLTPRKGSIPLNDVGYPVGQPLRWVAKELEKRGFKNGKGRPYHPYQVQQELIFDGLTEIILGRSRCAVRESLEESCRQKSRYEHDA